MTAEPKSTKPHIEKAIEQGMTVYSVSADAVLANLTGFCRANTTCPECGTTVYRDRQAYVTPFNAPIEYLYVALHPMCGPQVRVEIPATRVTRESTRDA